ncbi:MULTISPECIES: T9SS type A sorting domain-containing protein [Flavobacterium]|uniref:T9SS type A sorting domain-containing protein n=1 Tax=Flavobacterium suzhouense TaxID=1529638 RepID=A0ABW5NRG3_9FLAO|nr:T9SS type A sorting domain-containing protein [Flavobacterium sp. AG291]RDI10238.1 putative secreted protein (Por secretion system target) [Flavobacterium sp. AG291]
MKKIILAAALFVGVFAQAQIIVMDGDVELQNNQTYTYNVYGSEAKMHFLVLNNTEETINVKLKMVDSDVNPLGNQVQFCYGGYCFNTAPEGTLAPPGVANEYTEVLPNGTSGAENYFYNQYQSPVSYTMALVHVNAAGEQTGEPIITFTYKYDPTASTTDFASLEKMGIVVNNTVVKNTLDVTANQNAKLQIVNINGQIVKSATVVNGSQAIDLSSVAAGVYFARFTTEENKTAQIKFVKN